MSAPAVSNAGPRQPDPPHREARERFAKALVRRTADQLRFEIYLAAMVKAGWQPVGRNPVTGKMQFSRRAEPTQLRPEEPTALILPGVFA